MKRRKKFNDIGRVEDLQTQMNQIAEELKAAVGPGGKDRKLASVRKKAQDNVRKAIKRAIETIRGKHPAAAAHLDRSIDYSPLVCYRPERPTTWPA